MANTTDMIIVCFDEDDVILEISKSTGFDFLKTSDGSKCGGPKVLVFESYGACYRSIGKDKINDVINAFKRAKFRHPEFACLMICDDDDHFNGTITRQQDDGYIPDLFGKSSQDPSRE